MAALSPVPVLQFFDANGDPLVGGTLRTFAAGTTTPLATYTDASGTTQNPVQIILNARGEAAVWLGTQLYYMELHDAAGALIWTADNVGGFSAADGSSHIGFIQNGIGAVYRTAQSKMRDWVCVLDFGADPSGVIDSLAAFNAAAALNTTVLVVGGTYKISAPTAAGHWFLQKGVRISGLPDVGNPVVPINDTSRLTGRVFHFDGAPLIGLRLGSSNPWLERNIRLNSEGLAELDVLSPNGGIGGLFASRSSDNPAPNMQTIGSSHFGVNDNTASAEPSWSIYAEAVRYAGAGPSFGMECDFVNLGSTYDFNPYSPVNSFDPASAMTSSLWISCGGGDSGLAAGAQNISQAMTVLPNSKKFNRGIVFTNNSLVTGDAVTLPEGYRMTWFKDALTQTATLNNAIHIRPIYSDTLTMCALDESTKYKANGTGATQALDLVYRHNFNGYSGTAPYGFGFLQVIQRANFAAGNVRSSLDIQVSNDDGTPSLVSLNGVGNKVFAPTPDNTLSLGLGGNRWTVVFASTGAINTSDEREKQQISAIDAAVLRAWGNVEYCQFRYNDAVAIKGDGARWHVGLIAQRVKAAFEAEGLDPFAYGLLCYDEWEGQEAVNDENGNVIQHPAPAGDRYGIRYDEALALECAYLRSLLIA